MYQMVLALPREQGTRLYRLDRKREREWNYSITKDCFELRSVPRKSETDKRVFEFRVFPNPNQKREYEFFYEQNLKHPEIIEMVSVCEDGICLEINPFFCEPIRLNVEASS